MNHKIERLTAMVNEQRKDNLNLQIELRERYKRKSIWYLSKFLSQGEIAFEEASPKTFIIINFIHLFWKISLLIIIHVTQM